MTTHTFGITYDYLCPFARNANEHVVTALRAGAAWEVTFAPFSLAQAHLEDGEEPLWDRDDVLRRSGILALAVAEVVRAERPERFLDLHLALFALRHDQGGDLRDPERVAAVLDDLQLDAHRCLDGAEAAVATLAASHRHLSEERHVWGVPTFLGAERAVFVRFLDRPQGDAELARRRIERVVELVEDEPMLHEFKQVDLPQ
jgi:hypothetical protein